jgi:hypothetical protein
MTIQMKNFLKLITNLAFIKCQGNMLVWKLLNKEEKLRYNYKLNKNSLVFDVGGYQGDWSAGIYQKI